MKYVLIDIRDSKPLSRIIINQPERVIFDDKQGEDKKFICEKCFKEFEKNNLQHLNKCWVGWPQEGLCKNSKTSFTLFKLEKEDDYLKRKIVKIIRNLSIFSKLEQNIELRIPSVGILGKNYRYRLNLNKFCFYVLFNYKNIIGYCIVQIYTSLFGNDKIVIRDIYILPQYRGANYSFRILSEIANENNKKMNDLIFSLPISLKLKNLLKKNGFINILGIDGENLKNIKSISL